MATVAFWTAVAEFGGASLRWLTSVMDELTASAPTYTVLTDIGTARSSVTRRPPDCLARRVPAGNQRRCDAGELDRCPLPVADGSSGLVEDPVSCCARSS